MNDEFKVFLAGVFCGLVVFVVLIMTIPAGKIHEYDIAIKLCELELPRNQKCEIMARVKQE